MRYAIADIHGCCRTFQALIEKIQFGRGDRLYLLGDYIDRGPDSKGVLDTIMAMGDQARAILGNHEAMWLGASDRRGRRLPDQGALGLWLENGGLATLRSFEGVDTKPYLAFLRNLPLFLELEDFLLVHAEFDLSLSDPFGKEGAEAMLWSRGRPYHGKKPVLCGHTPLPLETIQAALKTKKINIDNGCCYIHYLGYHHLLAYGLDDHRLYIQENIEDPYVLY
jgi:serine/threonine protein phosphatase 1